MRALYVRTSTADQDGLAQLHALRTAAAARGWTDVIEYSDVGISGTKTSRPGLDALKKAVRTGSVREVMVVGLDRLGRSLRDLLVLLDDLTAAGCAVISLRESLDMSTPTGKLLVQVISALAEFERGIIVDRVRAGLRRAQAEGTRSGRAIGRPKREFDLATAKAMRAKGASYRKIAIALKVPRRTLERALKGV